MPKTLEQMNEALTKKYSGPILEKNGYRYIPWHEAVKHLDTNLGLDSYDVAIKSAWKETIDDTTGYAAIIRLEIHPSDGRAFFRDGLGFCELQTTKAGVPLIDTALKGAASNGIVRAMALLDDFGGLFLYDKDTSVGQQTTQASNNGKPVLSEGRVNVLKNKNFPPAAINQISDKLGLETGKSPV